jgi:hypothetical protein
MIVAVWADPRTLYALVDVYCAEGVTDYGDADEQVIEAKFFHNDAACEEAVWVSLRLATRLTHAPKHYE